MDKSQRNYVLTLGTDNPLNPLIIDFSKSAFTLEFDIQRNSLQSTNVGKFRIYNLSETNRQKIRKDELSYDVYRGVQLEAGYGSNLPVIFKGNSSHSWSVREGVNFISTIEAFDGGDAQINSVSDSPFTKGKTVAQVLTQLAGDMSKHNVSIGVIGKGYTNTLVRGNTHSGNTGQLLNTISGGGFFIDTEKVYLLGDDECVQGELLVINSDSGLLGTPVRSKNMIYFDVLFEPRIKMCQLLQLQSVTDKNFNGIYKVVSIAHRGIISDSVSGDAVTSLGLWQGPSGGSALKVVG